MIIRCRGNKVRQLAYGAMRLCFLSSYNAEGERFVYFGIRACVAIDTKKASDPVPILGGLVDNPASIEVYSEAYKYSRCPHAFIRPVPLFRFSPCLAETSPWRAV